MFDQDRYEQIRDNTLGNLIDQCVMARQPVRYICDWLPDGRRVMALVAIGDSADVLRHLIAENTAPPNPTNIVTPMGNRADRRRRQRNNPR